MHAARKANPELDFFLRWTEKCEGLALDSYLVLPIQRLPRYQLLLSELKKSTPADDPTLPDITDALSRIVNIAAAINESLHLKDSVEKVRALQAQFEKDARYMDIVTPNRVLIKEGPLKKKYSKDSRQLASAKNYHFFLFNDILLYASASKSWNKVSYKMKHYHSLLELDIQSGNTAVPGKKAAKDTGAFDIGITAKGKSFTVTCADETERDAWYQALKDTVASCKVSSKELTVSKFDGTSKKTTVNKSSKLAALTGT
jgi:FYVE/RhoGEF/PH domain-containing protein 5/6